MVGKSGAFVRELTPVGVSYAILVGPRTRERKGTFPSILTEGTLETRPICLLSASSLALWSPASQILQTM